MRHLLAAVAMIGLAGNACGDDDSTAPPDGAIVCSADSDCDNDRYCDGMERCDPDDPSATALGCVDGEPPCPDSQCNENDEECETPCVDADGDGSSDMRCGGDDCDDNDPNRFPSNTEVCDVNGVDEDCDPTTVGFRDIDSDGFHDNRCCNGDTCGQDCDETRRGTNPNVPEVCDGRDNDCDGSVDEELLQMVFADRDRDLQGDPNAPLMACPGVVGVSASNLDCDDNDPAINQQQSEFTDDKDNDCDEAVDEGSFVQAWYPDADGDGYGNPQGPIETSDRQPAGHALLPLDCADGDASRNPLADETCNGLDDDCNGEADFVIGVNDWEDDDGDGFPDEQCASGANADCDDTDAISYPGAAERCDARDNDCDGRTDEQCDQAMDGGTPPPDAGAMDAGVDSMPDVSTPDAGEPQCERDEDCDDGLLCTGVETCDAMSQCEMGTPLVCDDGDNATRDRCDEDFGGCLNEHFVVSFDVGVDYGCAVGSNGALACWGASSCGACIMAASDVPLVVPGFSDWTFVATGSVNTCAIRDPGGDPRVYCWGWNDFGQNGDGTATASTAPRNPVAGVAPVLVSVHTHHACAVDTSGVGHCWGNNDTGQLGDGTQTDSMVAVMAGSSFTQLRTGFQSTCAVSGNQLFCWGGTGVPAPLLAPTQMAFNPSVTSPLHLAAFDNNERVFVTVDGEVYDSNLPADLTLTADAGANQYRTFCRGSDHFCGIAVDGRILCGGTDNSNGQLGDGTTNVPTLPNVAVASTATDWTEIRCRQSTTCALNMAGELYCWGADDVGQRGDGDGFDTPGGSSPTQITF